MANRLPHESGVERAAWAAQWEEILAARDQLSCRQEGSRGPPFASHLVPASSFARWLPWNWYSLDGHGWCYDADWDELVRCSELDSVDWNGVSRSHPRSAWLNTLPDAVYLVPFCVVLFLLLTCYAYHEFLREERKIRMWECSPSHTQWPRSRRCLPWNWERSARLALLGAVLAVLVSSFLPILHAN